MLERIINVLKNYSEYPAEEMTKDSLLAVDLGLDSICVLDLVCEMEKEFSIQIPDRLIAGLNTIEDIQKVIEKCSEE